MAGRIIWNVMWELETGVSEVIDRTPTVRSIRFAAEGRALEYRAGQFLYATVKIDGQDATHRFSISSSPTEPGYLEFTKRITLSPYSQRVAAMEPGDRARLRGPGGSFVLDDGVKHIAYVTGGIGIAPVRSMLVYMRDKGLDLDVVLLYANRTVDDILFRPELDDLARLPGIRIEHVLEDDPSRDWGGRTGVIDRLVISNLIPDYARRLFYLSGPPGVVSTAAAYLRELGVPKAQLKKENFAGYEKTR